MLLSNTAIRNRTTVLVIIVAIVLLGTFSYMTLSRERFPDINIPVIIITTANPGVSPEDIESTITNEIEQKLTGIKAMKEISSTSMEGLSVIVVEFESGVDVDDALLRVKDKVDLAQPELPKNTDDPVEPIVREMSFSDVPFLMITLSGDISPVRMEVIAERLEDEIEVVPGVLEVDVLGALEREIVIEVDPDRLAQYGISLVDLLRLVPSQNVKTSAGGLETAGMKFSIRVPAEVSNPSEIDTFPIAKRNGKLIYLTDLATVKDSFKDRTSLSRLNGNSTITLAVKKRVGANIIDITDYIKAILAEAEKVVPLGVHIELTTDMSKDIRRMVSDLENNILTGLILVMIVLVLFMGIRSSLIVALAIPLSMLMSFVVLQAMGVTLNMVVLFALILALGMLVDNAIVIVENIYRYREMGYGKIDAAEKATAEVAWPVIASTATTVAAFFPLLFWPDVMGEFMGYIPLTVIVVLICSLLVALVISPVVCSVIGSAGRKSKGRQDDKPKNEGHFVRGYRKVLGAALNHPVVTVLLAVCVLAGVFVVYKKRHYGVELFPQGDPKEVVVDIRAPQGTNIMETDRITKLIEARLEPFRIAPEGHAQFQSVVTNVGQPGATGGGAFGGGIGGTHNSNIMITFPDYEERFMLDAATPWKSEVLLPEMRKVLEDIPGAEIRLERLKGGPPTGAAVSIRIIGDDTKVLKRLSDQIKLRIVDVPNLVNLRSDLEAEKPELIFVPRRKRAALLGISTAVVSNFLKTAVFGSKVGDYREFNDEYDIRIRLPLSQRMAIDDILRLRVPTDTGQSIPLSSLGEFEYRPGLGTIQRFNRRRLVTVSADVEGRLGPEVLKDVMALLEDMDVPPGYRLEYAGEKEEQDKATLFLVKALGGALLLIILILVAQFNTLSAPLIIMTTVVLSMVGVLGGLLAFKMPFCIVMTGVGIISLAGVVVNNAIVLLDYTRQLQRRGKSLLDAAVEAGVTRLRPVLLTATTTILGLVPMATGVSFDFHNFVWVTQSESSQWWSGMAIAVIFGLLFATLLTLVVVPSLYVMLHRTAAKFGLGGLSKPEDEAHHKPKPVLEDY